MKKKATVLVALISMCLIATAGIGAVSASDEPVGDYVITIFKINPDGTTTTIETFESSGPIVVKETMNEDGSRNIIREYRERTEDELHLDEACITTGTSETEVPMRIEEENFTIVVDTLENLTADTLMPLKPSKKIDASARQIYHEACTYNHVIGSGCCIYGYCYCCGVAAESCDSYRACYGYNCC
ncbi:MAG: hypothetical protein OCU22_10030 [Canidatus Methanoxibalbensis ujae]|nr:hypothetical protein [Candidatus Methanoxibalbensis ujae]